MNPAVTIALAATGKAPASTLLPYIGAQLAGAIAGSLSTWLTLGGAAREKFFLAATAPAGHRLRPVRRTPHLPGRAPLGAIIAAFVYDRFVGKADAP